MISYILRRLILVIPTLFGIMLINFALTQLVPGGPIDQIEARLEGEGDAMEAVRGSGDRTKGTEGEQGGPYVGARGPPPDFVGAPGVGFCFGRGVCTVR